MEGVVHVRESSGSGSWLEQVGKKAGSSSGWGCGVQKSQETGLERSRRADEGSNHSLKCFSIWHC